MKHTNNMLQTPHPCIASLKPIRCRIISRSWNSDYFNTLSLSPLANLDTGPTLTFGSKRLLQSTVQRTAHLLWLHVQIPPMQVRRPRHLAVNDGDSTQSREHNLELREHTIEDRDTYVAATSLALWFRLFHPWKFEVNIHQMFTSNHTDADSGIWPEQSNWS